MDKVKVDLKNCYGIKKLEKTLDFTKTRAYAIYAPNGVMKSSLAKTFRDAADQTDSSDRIFPARKTSRKITDQAGVEIEGDRVLVVLPYDEQFGPTEKTATLLVNPKLRKELEQLLVVIDEAKTALLKAVRAQAASKKDFEAEISSAFTSDEDFDIAMERIQKEIERQKDTPLSTVEYDKIFNDKVVAALEDKDVKDAIEDYVRRYNELLEASTYFRKGTFDYYNAGQIADSLAKNGFFDAKHTVSLNAAAGNREIKTQKDLEDVITQEKEAIITDKALRKKFDAVAKKLEKNVDLRQFCKYVQDNEPLLSRLTNLKKFKEDILKSYIKVNEGLYTDWTKKHDAARTRRKQIEDEARKERTVWEDVIAIFNDRFFVPFKLEARNRTEVILGEDAIIDLAFTYVDGTDSVEIARPALLEALSMGEKKALYVLNVIFEIQTRKKAGLETLVVIDDLADSFDYQNKYAIVQYLKDISEDGLFKLIMMTHNFDFFRTVESRFVSYSNCMMASKNDKGITLIQATGIRNVFANDWKGAFFTDSKKKIASIPFLRNLVEMTTGDADPNFLQLTSMLHWKADSAKITVGHLDTIYNSICKTTGASANAVKLVCELIEEEAKSCLAADGGMNLENKIVLAIAIRISAEKFMIGKISDPKFVASISAHQTQALISKFKETFPNDDGSIKILDRVALMTPENIHVNSFMYEPIIDMSDDHLRRLYTDISALK